MHGRADMLHEHPLFVPILAESLRDLLTAFAHLLQIGYGNMSANVFASVCTMTTSVFYRQGVDITSSECQKSIFNSGLFQVISGASQSRTLTT